MSIACLQQKLATQEMTSTALVEHYLQNSSRKKGLNAWITLDGENALEQANTLDKLRKQGQLLGPLHGIPLAIKDNIHVAGLPSTSGTPTLKHFIPTEDATVIKQLKQAGAIILGKTNMHELAYGITSNNYAFGAVGNAHNDLYISGGSSGGTATAIAADMASAGLGTDTGGSSRIPAALNGIAGFRPTTGRYSAEGLMKISNTRDTVGPMAPTVADIVMLDKVLSKQNDTVMLLPLKGIRLGVPATPFYESLEHDVQQATEKVLNALTNAGAVLVRADMPELQALNEQIGFPIAVYETAKLLPDYINNNKLRFSVKELTNNIASPDVKAIVEQITQQTVSEQAYHQAKTIYRPQLQQLYRSYFAQHNIAAIVFPTTILTARPIKDSLHTVKINTANVPTFPTYIKNTDPGSNAGIPGLTLPIAYSNDSLPIGLELDGPENSDAQLLALGLAIEKLVALQQQSCN